MKWRRRGAASAPGTDPAMEPLAPEGAEVSGDAVRSVDEANVAGERDIPSVARERSLQSRVHNILALVVVTLLGGGFLFWYYASQFSAQRAAKEKVEAERTAKAAGEMKLPPLGPVEGPRAASTDVALPPDQGPTLIGDVMGPAPALGAPVATAAPTAGPGPQGPPPKTPAELALERKLMPAVLYRPNTLGAAVPGIGVAGATSTGALPLLGGPGAAPPGGGGGPASIGNYLTPTVTTATSAQVLATRRFVIPKGNFVDCTLETAIDSQLPGLATCVTAFDIFGADGKVVLIERGSKLVGETRGETRQGMNRVFVLWNEARTPTGVVVQLASPATDALGRSGIAGQVDTHFWARFGAAIMISVIDGTVQALAQSQNRGGDGPAVIYNPQGSREIMTEVLRNTIAIPPTITVNQGARIQVMVARDVDFRPVYELRTARVQP